MTKRTIEDVKKIISDCYPSIEVLSDYYKDEDTLLKLRCLNCGDEWETRCANVMISGCKTCNEVNRRIKKLQEIKEKLIETNRDIEILDNEYFGATKKLNCRCKICGHEWKISWNILRDTGGTCENCNKVKRLQKKLEEIKQRLSEINPAIEILNDIYTGFSQKLNCRCRICNYEWKADRHHLIDRKQGCSRCAGVEKLTLEVVKERVSKISPNIEILSTEYINGDHHLDCKCKVCNYQWKSLPQNLFKGKGCSVCKNVKKYTLQEIKDLVFDINPNIEILSTEYKGKHEPLNLKCKVCSYEWSTSAHAITYGKTGCPKCAGHLQLTQEEIIQRMYKVNPNLKVIGEYTTIDEKIKMRCKICNNEWEAKAYHLVTGASGCPRCSASKGERQIENYLIANNFIKMHNDKYHNLTNNKCYIPQKEFKGLLGVGEGNLSYDFYLPQYNILIEYQGEFHDGTVDFQTEEDFIRQQEHDRRKREYAENNKIKLLEIWYWDYDNIEKILDKELNAYKIKIDKQK